MVMTQRSATAGERACSALERQFPGRVRFIAADVRDQRGIRAVLGAAVETFEASTFSATTRASACCGRSPRPSGRTTVLDTNLWGCLHLLALRDPPHGRRRRRGNRQRGLGRRHGRLRHRCGVLRVQGCRTRPHSPDGARLRSSRRARELCRPGFIETEADARTSRVTTTPAAEQEVVAAHPLGRWPPRGGRRGGRIPRLGRRVVRHRIA